MAINLTTQYSPKVAERFKQNSLTASAASKDYDFEGINTLKVYSVSTAPLNKYVRNGLSRYGTPHELNDSTQTMVMTGDESFTYTIDKGNNKEQLNIKGANRSLKRQIDEVVTPYLDKYNLGVWCKNAGSAVGISSAPTKTTITENVMSCTEMLDEASAPESGRTMFVKNAYYKVLKLNPDFIGNDKLGEAALVKGQVGTIDNMRVVKVPNSYMPEDIYWLIVHKNSILAPEKLADYKIHQDPPGVNGDLVEGRIMHDAFVIGEKAKAVCIGVASGSLLAAPTLTAGDGVVTVSAAASGSVNKYTLDGSDPRYSDTAKNVSGTSITIPEGTAKVIVAAVSTGTKYNSNTAELVL